MLEGYSADIWYGQWP